MGADTGTTFTIGQRVTVRLTEAVPTTGGLLLQLLTVDDRALPQGKPGKRGRYQPRKPGAAAARDAALRRKVIRKRR